MQATDSILPPNEIYDLTALNSSPWNRPTRVAADHPWLACPNLPPPKHSGSGRRCCSAPCSVHDVNFRCFQLGQRWMRVIQSTELICRSPINGPSLCPPSGIAPYALLGNILNVHQRRPLYLELGKDRIHNRSSQNDLPIWYWERIALHDGAVERFDQILHARLHVKIVC